MPETSSIRRSVLTVIFVFAAAGFTYPQSAQPTPVPAGQTEDPRHVASEKNNVFKHWVDEDVKYIITAAERAAFLKLTTNEERENFIKVFWDRRDPDPETEVNEFREEYYERIAYANEHFGSGVPGWKTDRGRIYITWGKPDSIESHPSGGSYDRPSYEGGGSTTTYPFETWFYRHLDGPGDGVEIEFVDPTGTGEYRIARDASEKNALANLPGNGQNNQAGFQREQDSEFSRLQMNFALHNPPQPKFSDLYHVLVDGPVIDNNPLAFDVRVDFFRQSDERVITAFTIQTNNNDLTFEQKGGLPTATLNILGRITSVSNKRIGIFEDSVTTDSTAADLAATRSGRSIYQKPLALEPGTYKVDVIVRDVGTGNRGIVSLGFVVPKYRSDTLSTSSMVLARQLRPANAGDLGGQFIVGDNKVVPNLSGVFRKGQDVGIYLEVYNALIDQTTLRPAVDVDYVLLKDGIEVLRKHEDSTGMSDSGRRLTLTTILSSEKLAIGDYEATIVIHDRVRGNVIQSKGKFALIK
jgi:GWxTD domain-containing protein